MPRLALGPVLRYVGEGDTSAWFETDASCEVEVLGRTAKTFQVEGHHYAVVCIDGLEPGTATEYDVRLDGEKVWPDPEFEDYPPSVIRTLMKDEPIKLVFGSCRVAAPHEPPHTLSKDADDAGRERDALYALALRMRNAPPETWPHVLFLCGDQVYADEVSPGAREFIEQHRDPSRDPGYEVANFEEYTRLYYDAWREPAIRWLLSAVSTSMIWDDHDVHDDWNTSQAWLDEYRAKPWWDERITGAIMSYWVYQHLGNLAPSELRNDERFQHAHELEDAGPMLREFARKADRRAAGAQWSYCRNLGNSKLIVMDSRAGRVLEPGKRAMLDAREWDWIEQQTHGDVDHVFLGTSLPVLLGRGMHYLEAWNERVCDGAWGRWAAKPGESIRQFLDLEHWAAFENSFHRLIELMRAVAAGERGNAPATIVALSGDVHHAYLAEVAFRNAAGIRSSVYQAVCSPFRNPLDEHERRAIRFGTHTGAELVTRSLARLAGAKEPAIRWRFAQDPTFDNQVATIDIDGREAVLSIEKTLPAAHGTPELHKVFERRLA